jgi:hypothetical protein
MNNKTPVWKEVEPAPPVTLDMMAVMVNCNVVAHADSGNDAMPCVAALYDKNTAIRRVWRHSTQEWISGGSTFHRPDQLVVLSRLDGEPLPEVKLPLKDRTRGLWFWCKGLACYVLMDNLGNTFQATPQGDERPLAQGHNVLTTGPGYRLVEDEAEPEAVTVPSVEQRIIEGLEWFLDHLKSTCTNRRDAAGDSSDE